MKTKFSSLKPTPMNNDPYRFFGVLSALLSLFVFHAQAGTNFQDSFEFHHQQASASFAQNRLVLSTGLVQRTWSWTGEGLVTTSLENVKTKKQWVNTKPNVTADWAYYGLIDGTQGELLSIKPSVGNDEGFTSEYLQIEAIVYYKAVDTYVKYQAWAYPNAPGIRTQVFFKGPAEQYYKGTADNQNNRVRIEQVNGKNENPYESQALAFRTVASQSVDTNSLQFHIKGLNPDTEYQLGVLCWDWDRKGRKYRVKMTSVDGEIGKEVLKARAMDHKPAMVFMPLPVKQLATDGSIRVYLENMGSADVRVSEVVVLEKSTQGPVPKSVDMERYRSLEQEWPQGYRLAEYLDAGVHKSNDKMLPTGRVDYLPINFLNRQATLTGYFNDTQHRNTEATPIMKQEVLQVNGPVDYNWANLIDFKDGQDGLVMLKESHKCVNQYGVDTGEFTLTAHGLSNTGTSLYPADIDAKGYHWSWASWLILYDGEEGDKQLAIKEFDRLRYPTIPERDMYTMICTWGMSKDKSDGQDAASEASVLKLLKESKELGVDLLLIDDGWQVGKKHDGSSFSKGNGWNPHPEVYPTGWGNVVRKAQQLDMKLGLWGIARGMETEDMIRNWDELRMTQLKLDFASFPDNGALENMMSKVRKFIQYTDFQSSISWDLTENAPRYGYYWAREYGNVHVMNRKNGAPANVTYNPSLALRDFWYISHYTNLNKFQLTIHNPEIVDRSLSDAYLYSPAYCVATTLFGTPQFFSFPSTYSAPAKRAIQELLAAHKRYQKEIWTSQVFPIGAVPDNRSYTGFQAVGAEGQSGFLLLFREYYNEDPVGHFKLNFLESKKVELEDLLTGKTVRKTLGPDGQIDFSLSDPAEFQLLKYTVVN